MELKRPYALFLGDVADNLAAKTAQGIVDWRRDWCVGQIRLPGCKADTGLPDMTVAEARDAGAQTLIIGVVNAGGVLPEHWIDTIASAIDLGMDCASGLHIDLHSIPQISSSAKASGRDLYNVRRSNRVFATGKGTPRSGRRLLTVGTDCSVGKKYTALALERDMQEAGLKATFCATGQTGVFISGRGVAIDAVVADFISGAAEWISPETEADHWQVVEGQGSLFHPSFAGVSLGLLHGSQPDAFVVCHEPTRTRMRGVETSLPSIGDVIEQTKNHGRLTNPGVKCVGIAVNTSALEEAEAQALLSRISSEYGFPAVDPIRTGTTAIIQRLQQEFPA